jgi:hypothetical protein
LSDLNDQLPKGWKIISGELWLHFNGEERFFLTTGILTQLVYYANNPRILYDRYKPSYMNDGRGDMLLKYIDSLNEPSTQVSDGISYTNCTKCNYLYSYGGPAICSGCKVWSVIK